MYILKSAPLTYTHICAERIHVKELSFGGGQEGGGKQPKMAFPEKTWKVGHESKG